MDRVDVVIIGAGVVGLAIARELALTGREVIILDAEDAIGTHTSSRNSEVIHAGIYYPKGSLKARSCVEGKRLLYDYCASHGVPHRRCGKLIVATSEKQLEELNAIRARAHANGSSLMISHPQASIKTNNGRRDFTHRAARRSQTSGGAGSIRASGGRTAAD